MQQNLCNYPELESDHDIPFNTVIISREIFDLLFKHWEEIKKILDEKIDESK